MPVNWNKKVHLIFSAPNHYPGMTREKKVSLPSREIIVDHLPIINNENIEGYSRENVVACIINYSSNVIDPDKTLSLIKKAFNQQIAIICRITATHSDKVRQLTTRGVAGIIFDDGSEMLSESDLVNWIEIYYSQLQNETLFFSSTIARYNKQQNIIKSIFRLNGTKLYLWGENGTGKKRFVKMLHTQLSPQNPLLKFIDLSNCKYIRYDSSLGLILHVKKQTDILNFFNEGPPEYLPVFTGLEKISGLAKKKLLEWLKKTHYRVIFLGNDGLDSLYKQHLLAEEFLSLFFQKRLRIWTLSERKVEIEKIITHFLQDPTVCTPSSRFHNLTCHQVFTESAICTIKNYPFLGNLSELKELLRDLLIKFEREALLEDRIDNKNLPLSLMRPILGKREVAQQVERANSVYKKNGFSLRAVAEDFEFSREYDFIKYFKKLFNKHPEVFNNRHKALLERIGLDHRYNYSIRLFIWIHEANRRYVEEFKKKLEPLLEKFPHEVVIYGDFMSGVAKTSYLKKVLSRSHKILLFACSQSRKLDDFQDIIQNDEYRDRFIPIRIEKRLPLGHLEDITLLHYGYERILSDLPCNFESLDEFYDRNWHEHINIYMADKLIESITRLPVWDDPLDFTEPL